MTLPAGYQIPNPIRPAFDETANPDAPANAGTGISWLAVSRARIAGRFICL